MPDVETIKAVGEYIVGPICATVVAIFFFKGVMND